MKDEARLHGRSFLSYICHQDPARCFYFNGKPMKLCARCTGLYIGLVIGIVIITTIIFLVPGLELTSTQILLILFVGVGPFAVDGVTQYWGLRVSTNVIRLITGLICGVMIGIILIWIFYDIII